MQIRLAHGGQEAVAVVLDVLHSGVCDPQAVVRDQLHRQQTGEQPVTLVDEFGAPDRCLDHHPLGHRPQRADSDPARHGVRPEQAVRVVMGTAHEPVDLPRGQRCFRQPDRRRRRHRS
jgi:hypothetical protein